MVVNIKLRGQNNNSREFGNSSTCLTLRMYLPCRYMCVLIECYMPLCHVLAYCLTKCSHIYYTDCNIHACVCATKLISRLFSTYNAFAINLYVIELSQYAHSR